MAKAVMAPIILRVGAFFIDIFTIAIPMLYFTTYVILGSKEKFLHSQSNLIIWFIYGIILSFLQCRFAQSGGYRFFNLYILDNKTKTKISFSKAFVRYILFILTNATFIGIFIPFFRKDKRNLYDILTNTIVAKRIN